MEKKKLKFFYPDFYFFVQDKIRKQKLSEGLKIKGA